MTIEGREPGAASHPDPQAAPGPNPADAQPATPPTSAPVSPLRFWGGRDTPATYAMVGLMVVGYVGELAWIVAHGGNPGASVSWPTLFTLGAFYSAEPWRAASSVLLHQDLFSTVIGFYSILVLGVLTERLIGSLRVVIAVVLGIAAAAAVGTLLSPAYTWAGTTPIFFALVGAMAARAYFGRPPLSPQARQSLQGTVLIVLLLNAYLVISSGSAGSMARVAGSLVAGAGVGLLPLPESGSQPSWVRAGALVLAAVYLLALAVSVAHVGEQPPF